MVTIKKIRELRKTLEVTKNEPLKSKVLASLVGRLSEAEQIHPAYKKNSRSGSSGAFVCVVQSGRVSPNESRNDAATH